MPKPSLPARLALLVAGTTLPLIIFAAVLVFNNYEQDRKDASQRVLETVRSIRLVLDAEMQRMTGGLQVLALTDTLAQRRLREFSPHRFGLSRSIWQGRRRAGGGPRRPPVVLLGHAGHREPAAAQQPRNRGKGVRDQEPAIFEPVRRRGEEAADRDGRSAGASRRRGALRRFLQPADRDFPVHHRKAAPEQGLDDLDLRRRAASISRAFQTRKRPSASAHRRRCMPRCFASRRRPCRRYRSKACR